MFIDFQNGVARQKFCNGFICLGLHLCKVQFPEKTPVNGEQNLSSVRFVFDSRHFWDTGAKKQPLASHSSNMVCSASPCLEGLERETRKSSTNVDPCCKASSHVRSLSRRLVFRMIWQQADTQASTQVCTAPG